MIRKTCAEPLFRLSNFLWLTLVLLLVGLIWRGLGAFLTFVENHRLLPPYADVGGYLAFIADHLFTDWSTETLSFLGQIIGLAVLFQFGPLQNAAETEKDAEPVDTHFRGNEPEAS